MECFGCREITQIELYYLLRIINLLQNRVHGHLQSGIEINLKYKARKSLGQNFLIDIDVINKTIDAADIIQSDTILEIGPGTGKLTEAILLRSNNVIGIELDGILYDKLQQEFNHIETLKLFNQDARTFDYDKLLGDSDYKLLANLPYYAATYFLRMFLESNNQPVLMVLMFQKEVADTILAKPGKMRLLSVLTQLMADVERVCDAPKDSFEPEPSVTSTVVKFIPKPNYFSSDIDYYKFVDLLKGGFSAPRKMIANSMSNYFKIPKPEINTLLENNNINPSCRSETLQVSEWIQLFTNACDKLPLKHTMDR